MTTIREPQRLDREPFAASVRLRALIDANWTTQAISAAVQLRLPEVLTAGPQTSEALSRQTSCHASSLLRLLRALASIDIVVQQEDERFALTETGSLLRADTTGSLAAWAELGGTTSWAAWGHLSRCVQSGNSVRKQDGGADDFRHLEENPDAALLFNRAMAGLSRPIAAAVASEIDFAEVESIVDVGGGYGELLTAILLAHPQMRGVLFDMPHAIDAAHEGLARAGVADRCQTSAGSFFEELPAGADAYLLKSILHDWSDERCLEILRNCARAMPPAGRLMIVERLMPKRLTVSTHDQGIARADLNMLIAQDGRERTLDQYRMLLTEVGLRLMEPTVLRIGFAVLTARK